MSEIHSEYSRRQFLMYQSMIDAGTTAEQATETLASAATEHPEWDLDEQMTWAEWEERKPRGRRATTDVPERS